MTPVRPQRTTREIVTEQAARGIVLAGDGRLGDVLLREAEVGDEMAVARVHVRAWQVGYRGLLPDGYLDSLDPADRAARYTFGDAGPDRPTTVVAVEGDVIRGFATTGPCREPGSTRAGQLSAIYVHPDRWGDGLGRALIGDARARLVRRGFSQALLWVLAGNTRAERFYRADGWEPDGRIRREEVHGLFVDEIGYRTSLAA